MNKQRVKDRLIEQQKMNVARSRKQLVSDVENFEEIASKLSYLISQGHFDLETLSFAYEDTTSNVMSTYFELMNTINRDKNKYLEHVEKLNKLCEGVD